MMAAPAVGQINLAEMLRGVVTLPDAHDREIHGLRLDSRAVTVGDCFVALRGTRTDGMAYADEAVARGAVAILTDTPDASVNGAIPVVFVGALRKYLGHIAARFFDHPSTFMDVIAATGTNGKTTVTQLCARALSKLDRRAGYVGTLGIGPIDALRDTTNTTPDPISLQHAFARMRARDCDCVAVEVSSHALCQARITGTAVDVAVLTNVGHDHLDYHDSFAAYAAVKKSLFNIPGLHAAVINTDDQIGCGLIGELPAHVDPWTFGGGSSDREHSATHIGLEQLVNDKASRRLMLRVADERAEIQTPLLGRFNAENLLAACGALCALGIKLSDAAAALSHIGPIKGRMELVREPRSGEPLVVVDYAHTPESLAKALASLREMVSGQLICVFGCGGDRDRSKRAPMGRAAEHGADAVILTSDNPRGESNQQITTDVLSGCASPSAVAVIDDRGAAIRFAIAQAKEGDVVLIAGKGHELYQEISGDRHPFCDHNEAVRALAAVPR